MNDNFFCRLMSVGKAMVRMHSHLASCLAILGVALISAADAALAVSAAVDPNAPVPSSTYRPVIKGYVPFRPVEPRSWRDVNEQVAPKPRAKMGGGHDASAK